MRPSGYGLGLILITASAVAWSTAGLFTRLIPSDSWTILGWRGIFGALGIAAVILALERRNAWAGFRQMGWPSWLFAIVSAVGLALFTLGARLLPAIETALIGSLDAPLAPLWVWLVFSETPSASTIAGGLIVFVAVTAHVVAEASQVAKASS